LGLRWLAPTAQLQIQNAVWGRWLLLVLVLNLLLAQTRVNQLHVVHVLNVAWLVQIRQVRLRSFTTYFLLRVTCLCRTAAWTHH
jgi:hypothetical protein